MGGGGGCYQLPQGGCCQHLEVNVQVQQSQTPALAADQKLVVQNYKIYIIPKRCC
jgi:hypothetical protein